MNLTESEINTILSNWGIDKYKCKVLKGGVVNNNWIVSTNKNKFVLREVSRFKNKRSLRFEFKYLKYLKSEGFEYKIPIPILTKTKTEFITYDGKVFWLYEYIKGKIKKELNFEEVKTVAKMMAEYHKLSVKKRFNKIRKSTTDPFFKSAILNFSLEMRSIAFKKKLKNREDFEFLKMVKILIVMLKNLQVKGYANLNTYPLHADIKGDNLIWNKKNIIGVIDFDNVGRFNDTIIKDIANFIQFSCKKKK